MADPQRSEKPTKRRLDRARKEGDFPASREFLTSIQFLGFVTLITLFFASFLTRIEGLMRRLLAAAFSANLTVPSVTAIARQVILPELTPLLYGGTVLVAITVCAQLATTRLGFSFEKLTPNFQRLNPARRLAAMPSQNLFIAVQAVFLLAVVGLVVYYEVSENLDSFLELPWLAPHSSAARVGGAIETLLWRAAALFLLVGVIDLLWQRRRYTKQLSMTKHEIREESKEQESSPQVKMRIRRLQRDLARRKMMQQIPTATAVIVNPTHYAVAIRYAPESAAAPRVIAKGKNYLALRIRKKAIVHQVPIVENPLLARALYDSVEVGQEIPTHLYRAVAEILAYIYKLMNGKLPG
jgi:flagellar biosynthetic protein FlhB